MSNTPTLAHWIQQASARLPDSDSPQLDTELLLCHVLQQNRSYLHTWPDKPLDDEQLRQLDALLTRRQQGEPIAYLLGTQEFWSLTLQVSPAVLIPRPETELIIDAALELFSPKQSYRFADLGTGSGAIALALASEFPLSHVVAGDVSAEALAVAEQNRQQLQLHNCEMRLGSWLEIFYRNEHFDLIAANPPYIADDDPHLEANVFRYEPHSALTSGSDGLSDLRHIITQAPQFLAAGGWLMLEHGWQQATEVQQLMQQRGLTQIHSRRDLAGHERITLGQKP